MPARPWEVSNQRHIYMRIWRSQVKPTVFQVIGLLALGVGTGALSWVAARVVSGRFEPYDSSIGLATHQIVLCLPVILLACRFRLALLLFYFLGAWFGMNSYAYVFGSSEQRAWAMLGVVTSLLLLALPVGLMVVIAAIRQIWSRWGAARGVHSPHGK